VSEIFSLSLHATWRCRHSGACCSSNWPISIDASRRARVDVAIQRGALAPTAGVAPFGVTDEASGATLLGVTASGQCAFHDGDARRCRVHAALDHEALPLPCRMFPRVCLIDARGVRVSLSHYCPSAADRLFDADSHTLDIVRNPAAFPADGEYEGLDARDTFPPLLRPGVLLDWDTVDALEQLGVAAFAAETVSADAALARFAAACEELRGWRASEGPMIERLRGSAAAQEAEMARATHVVRGTAGARSASQLGDWPHTLARDAEVRSAVPAEIACPAVPDDVEDAYRRYVEPVWPAFTRPVSRYLAARLFGSWTWYHGHGLRSLVRSLDAALSVLRIEAARQTGSCRMLDRDRLREAIRQTDLLLLHLASRDTLAARWNAAEREGTTV
jgi:Fe-S-cluster containining protein